MIRVLSVVGKRDCGKTTLLEGLIPELKSRGYRVGTIKHDVHGFEIDHEGKDTYKHFHAGADSVVIASDGKVALIKRLSSPLSLDELVQRYFDGADIVITEGYKAQDKPKIEVFRSTIHDKPLCTDEDNRIAIVTDVPLDDEVPQFDHGDWARIGDFVESYFDLKK